ncbi:MAG: RNB domain-containing ribonuclease [Actinomycetaceae bacterium]|nr:RNB domain-containing ribonuclease [Actinomycetaceae bacterium]
MPQPPLRPTTVPDARAHPVFNRIRREIEIPTVFPEAALNQAQEAASTWQQLVSQIQLHPLHWEEFLADYLRQDGANPHEPDPAHLVRAVRALPQVSLPRGLDTGLLLTAAIPATDATCLPLVTIDPPQSTDLDQAVAIFSLPSGPARYLLIYAIASVATFVEPGSPLDEHAWQRGTSVYLPDETTPLYPETISSGAGSLLPQETRPSCVWTMALDEDGNLLAADVHRALVRSRAKLSYADMQAAVEGDQLPGGQQVPADLAQLFETVGRLRQAREVARGGVSARIPEQVAVREGSELTLQYRANTVTEEWNAQISLLTGMAAAKMMRAGNAGIVRTLPPAQERDLKRLRAVAGALGISWPAQVSYPQMVRNLDPKEATHAAFLLEATSLFRGSGYRAFGVRNTEPLPRSLSEGIIHAAINAEYAHVTAPLRRLADRYALEVCLAHCAGTSVPEWVREKLDDLPKAMATTGSRAGRAGREAVAALQALVLEGHEGQVFRGAAVDERGEKMLVMLSNPAVLATCDADLELGMVGDFKLVAVDVQQRRVEVEPVSTR